MKKGVGSFVSINANLGKQGGWIFFMYMLNTYIYARDQTFQ